MKANKISKKGITAECLICKKVFYYYFCQHGGQKMCSKKCVSVWRKSGISYKKSKTVEERFWDKVDKTNNCWEWKSQLSWNGYGEFSPKKSVKKRAHRFSWELFNAKIPKNLFVLHKCDNRKCVNPGHLFLGTQKDNIDDMLKKGRERKLKGDECPWAKLNTNSAKEIREKYKSGKFTQYKLAELFSMSQSQINNIIQRKQWK